MCIPCTCTIKYPLVHVIWVRELITTPVDHKTFTGSLKTIAHSRRTGPGKNRSSIAIERIRPSTSDVDVLTDIHCRGNHLISPKRYTARGRLIVNVFIKIYKQYITSCYGRSKYMAVRSRRLEFCYPEHNNSLVRSNAAGRLKNKVLSNI